MSSEIVVYSPLLEIVTYENESYYVDASKKDKLIQFLTTQQFVDIGQCILASKSIRKIQPADNERTMIEYRLKSLEKKEEKKEIYNTYLIR